MILQPKSEMLDMLLNKIIESPHKELLEELIHQTLLSQAILEEEEASIIFLQLVTMKLILKMDDILILSMLDIYQLQQ